MKTNLSARDFILLLLDSDNKKPIVGNLFFQKEMFLIVEEICPDLKEELQFFPYDYGPFSKVLVNLLKELNDYSLILIENVDNSIRYSITKKGEEYIGSVDFPQEIRDKVTNLKIGSNRLGYKGLLRYVYFNYPKFTTNSKIKNEVLGEDL